MKAVLYLTIEEWEENHVSIMNYLCIPTSLPVGLTETYAVIQDVINPTSSDYGKYIFPVATEGKWKCVDQFSAGDLVDWDQNWFLHDE